MMSWSGASRGNGENALLVRAFKSAVSIESSVTMTPYCEDLARELDPRVSLRKMEQM